MTPGFFRRLSDPAIRNVLLCGCGGGFDFVHGLLLLPELKRLGKEVVIGSYSFGDPSKIGGGAPIVFEEEDAIAKRVTAADAPDPHYAPEIHVCSFLDARHSEAAPHFVYAYYARAFTVPRLTRLYRQLVDTHAVDAIVLVDGGSDSLMAGDEEGLGDPIEDAVSVTTVAGLDGLRAKILVSVGFGADRFNHVSDAASLRAVAELTARGGFLGAIACGCAASSAGSRSVSTSSGTSSPSAICRACTRRSWAASWTSATSGRRCSPTRSWSPPSPSASAAARGALHSYGVSTATPTRPCCRKAQTSKSDASTGPESSGGLSWRTGEAHQVHGAPALDRAHFVDAARDRLLWSERSQSQLALLPQPLGKVGDRGQGRVEPIELSTLPASLLIVTQGRAGL